MNPSNQGKKKVLLIGWDGADWEHITPLLEEGLLPTLEGLINRGVMGNIATLQPVLSPMLWNSIASGKHAYKHGIYGFIEPNPQGGGARPYTSYSRKTRAIWNMLTLKGYRTNVINWWASHPAEKINGCVVTNAIGGAKFDPALKKFSAGRGTVHPEKWSDFFAKLRVFPHELVSEQILPFAPGATELNQEEDSRLTTLAKVIAETMTTHNVATAAMELEPWDFMAVYYTGVDHFSHGFMQYHPPRLSYVPEKDFEIFKDVIKGCYRFHDMMLERLLQLAGPDTTVVLCSDHGFHSRESRPMITPREPTGPAVWHRRYGIFVAAGPDIKRDERVYGASLLDVTPTILTLCGEPIGADMDGRPLIEIFENQPKVQTIPSWDDLPGDCGMHKAQGEMDREEADELMRQFAALGYIDDPGEDLEAQGESADIEAKYNLARNLQWLGFHEQAQPLLEEVLRRAPWEDRFIVQLADFYIHAGFLRQTVSLLEKAYDLDSPKNHGAKFLWTIAKFQLGELGDIDELKKWLQRSEKLTSQQFFRLGEMFLRKRDYELAGAAFELGVAKNPDNAEALVGLAGVLCRDKKFEQAVELALRATGLVYRLPKAHYVLGLALLRSDEPERAEFALKTAIRFGPNYIQAHRLLSHLYRKFLNDPKQADHHAAEVERIRNRPIADKEAQQNRRNMLFELPEFDSEQKRHDRLIEERPDRVDPRKRSGKTFTLVSGLPRSGTSLMMQMLEAGGLPPKTDDIRQADVDNPKGYMEWEKIKQVGKNPAVMNELDLDKKAIKVISMLLQKLPPNHDYKIIFMTRPVEEVVESQAAMITRLNTEGANLDSEQIERGLASHRQEILGWLAGVPRIKHLVVDYPTLVESPEEIIQSIAEFLGPEILPNPERMISAVDPSLYRRRVSET